ncbi:MULTISPECIES: DEAD/DEAH box helicase [Streptomyces]|uniref:DEAD/DEAH box helicase n=2 Tax=Streptomyces TaxID=1883 RepID=A0A652KK20_9ACTN|nr:MULTISPECIES: DEAD/DEAH box helicase [unclassified Streptomyces]MDX3325548.1 DEAD/DEAH box helicase [Streptomyces sp. ME02-6979-3A]MDX3428953.1 DEAD/DEAH box helicase [Streptomyces sp. ME01-18a]TXS24057.1 DEAD/DEAH box helicase [Streptomyces sp. gb1(2016)]
MTAAESSLHIGFDVTRTKAVLRASEQCRSDLNRLAARFPGGGLRGRLALEVTLDDFLVGIDVLADWPHPESVVWADELSALVGEVLDDADRAERQLQTPRSDSAWDASAVELALGPTWRADLTEFQRRDIGRLLSLQHGANFSVPGAGKTRVGLAVYAAMRERGEVRRLLVVSPKSAYEAWLTESELCFKEPPLTCVMGKTPDGVAEIMVVNYERLDRSLASLATWLRSAPSMIILDEAHRMKLGAQGKYGSACMALGPLTRRRLILTGTPAPNGARDLENLLSFVWPGHGRRVVTQAVAGGDLAYASSVLRPLFTRTTKKELGLPPFETRIRRLKMPELHREVYDALVGRFTTRAEASRDDFDALGKAMLRLLMAATSPALLVEGGSRYEPLTYQVPPLEVPKGESLYALMGNLPAHELSPKYKEALNIVATNAALGRKTLVWTTFVRSITTMESLFAAYQPAVVHGGTPDREEQIRRFREDPDCHVLLSNPATLGEGISLHHVCHDAVYVDRDFMAGRFLQSLDRIHRLGLAPGTRTRVTVLAVEGTIDEVVAMRLEEKLEFMGQILDDPSVQQLGDLEDEPSGAAGMDMADVRALLNHVDAVAGH